MKWLNSYRAVGQVHRLCSETMLVSVGDREADIYELFEGPLNRHVCLFNKPVCNGHCIMGDLLHDVQKLVSSYMKNTTLCNAAIMMKEGRIRVGTDYSEN